MKLFASGDQALTIGGKRVPYSLLGAGAAILGAFLIWKQMGQNGGFSLGQQSPDLSGLGSGGGGSAGADLGNAMPDLSALLGSGPELFASPGIPVYDLSYPAPVVGPVYGMAPTPAPIYDYFGTKTTDLAPSTSLSLGGLDTGLSSGTSYVGPSLLQTSAQKIAASTPRTSNPYPSLAPALTFAAKTLAKPAPAPTPAGGGGGSFTA